jgi:hypothetical protein
VQLLADAVDKNILVVASTQCFTGSVMMGHYATGVALKEAGVVSTNDMTLEAISCKSAYLLGYVLLYLHTLILCEQDFFLNVFLIIPTMKHGFSFSSCAAAEI